MEMTHRSWTGDERRTLDALLPPTGSFPLPSRTGIIDDFIIPRLEPSGSLPVPYPGLTADDLKAILLRLDGSGQMTAALR